MTELEIIREAVANRADIELHNYQRQLSLFGGSPLFQTISAEHNGYQKALYDVRSIIEEAISQTESEQLTAEEVIERMRKE